MDNPLLRRVGRFRIAQHIALDEQENVRRVMARCVVVRCEMMYVSGAFEYTALSPDFDVVTPDCEPPEYAIVFHDGGERFEFRRYRTLEPENQALGDAINAQVEALRRTQPGTYLHLETKG